MIGDGEGDAPRTRSRRSQQGRRNPRLRLACLRCQRRKIRCDGESPTCKNCKNAGAVCTDGESARLPRTYITNLKRRISWLEDIVRSRCPDVDLGQGPSADEPEDARADETLDDTSQAPVGSSTPPVIQRDVTPIGDITVTSTQPLERSTVGPVMAGSSALSHEIGLVSLGINQDARYIGPSSGYFLARVMLNFASRHKEKSTHEAPFPTQLVEACQGPLPLPPRDAAKRLFDAYFDVIHLQYPILHQPTWTSMMNQVYDQGSEDPVSRFQVFMALAIGSTVLSGRHRARIPGESYFLSALKYFEQLNLENSLQGVQALLLILIFTIHSPYVRLNLWYLNYHCLASLLDLGLQRDINVRSGITLLEQEMRTRIFWVIMSMDRIIATMMGRPIGVRDEACELRMPQGLSDDALLFSSVDGTLASLQDPTQMEFAVHLFRATKLNSEIKYVANSIVRDSPVYAYPSIRSIDDWQSTMLQKLNQWAADIPGGPTPSKNYLRTTCLLKYHSLRMLLLRPSPAIVKPSSEALIKCHESACESIRLFDDLYRQNLLVHSLFSFHSLVLSTITMLYCIKVVPELSRKTELDVLMGNMSVALSILSATGEHWSGAKRSRDILDELGRSMVRWLRDTRNNRPPTSRSGVQETGGNLGPGIVPASTIAPTITGGIVPSQTEVTTAFMSSNDLSLDISMNDPFDDLLFNGSFAEYFEASNSVNVDNIVRDLFQDFIPTYPSFT